MREEPVRDVLARSETQGLPELSASRCEAALNFGKRNDDRTILIIRHLQQRLAARDQASILLIKLPRAVCSHVQPTTLPAHPWGFGGAVIFPSMRITHLSISTPMREIGFDGSLGE